MGLFLIYCLIIFNVTNTFLEDATQAGENNWSDLEEEAETSRNYALDNDQMEADDDLAADEENLIETQNSSEDDNDEEGTDTDASAG